MGRNIFSKKDTCVMKGVAILFMLMHHLWAFPDRIMNGELSYFITIFGQSATSYIGMFGKICVSLFFFLGGYGLYVSSKNKEFNVLKRIKKLYFSYWKVFCVFIPIAFIFCSKQIVYCESSDICGMYTNFSIGECFGNFLGLSSSYNYEWWFFMSYVVAIITFPLIKKLIERHSAIINVVGVIILSILFTSIFPTIGNIEGFGYLRQNALYAIFFCQSTPFIACFWMGCVMAKDNLLDRLRDSLQSNNMLNPFMDMALVMVIVFVRNQIFGAELDILYVPVLIIVSIDLLDRIKIVQNIFDTLGKHSTNMWLIHSFYCYYFYKIVKIVVCTGYAIPSLLILVGLSLISSIVLNFFWKEIFVLKDQFSQKISLYRRK